MRRKPGWQKDSGPTSLVFGCTGSADVKRRSANFGD